MARIALPDAPAVVAGHGRAAIFTADGELLLLPAAEAAVHLRALPPPMLVHAPATFRRLGLRGMPAFDLLELFAFALPARPAAPTPRGLALMLDFEPPTGGLEAEAALLPELAAALLHRLSLGRDIALNRDAAGLAARMGQAGWGWAPFVTAALGKPDAAPSNEALRVWKRLPEWEDTAPLPPPSAHPVGGNRGAVAARQHAGTPRGAAAGPGRLRRGRRRRLRAARNPRRPASRAGRGRHRNRQDARLPRACQPVGRKEPRQRVDQHLHPPPAAPDRCGADRTCSRIPSERHKRVVVRKGRENYLCLLNLEDALGAATSGLGPAAIIPLGLISRWALVTADGDIQGGDLPGWLAELFGAATILGLADRRGECIHAACPHWRRCFVEHTIRRARSAQLVVANHALVMTQAAWGGLDDSTVPTRYVFDEGHHVFDAADGAFSAELSGLETAELRRWLLGAEGGRSRARGLKRRIEELVAARPMLEAPLEAALQAARALPAPGWSSRLANEHPDLGRPGRPGSPNPTEAFLRLIRHQVFARTRRRAPRRGAIRGAGMRRLPDRPRRGRGRGSARPRDGADRRTARHVARTIARASG